MRKLQISKYGDASPPLSTFVNLVRQGILSPVSIPNVSIIAAAPASPYKHLFVPQRNVFENISHSSSTCNGSHVGLLFKIKNIQKEIMISQTPFIIFKSVMAVNIVKINGLAQMVVVLTHKEMSYLLAGLFDDLLDSLSY